MRPTIEFSIFFQRFCEKFPKFLQHPGQPRYKTEKSTFLSPGPAKGPNNGLLRRPDQAQLIGDKKIIIIEKQKRKKDKAIRTMKDNNVLCEA